MKTKCDCGEPLPMHLLELADDRFSHVCSCERVWKLVDGKPKCTGTEINPFARYDRGKP
jgi:hypothetical protein